MPASYYDSEGNHIKECTKCKLVQPVEEYYRHTPTGSTDGLVQRCRHCVLAKFRDENARRNKKRKQRTHKLTKHQVAWIKEQKDVLSIRETARQFAKKFWAIKVNPSTVQRIFSGKIHAEGKDEETISVYDMLDAASQFSGSAEDYLDSTDIKKVKL
tara:strand:- start:312 stop:782 length:471 start_codon:yes stop_codon:yes gene_type:complete